MKKKEYGYLTVEAAFWIPAISLFLGMLIWLCSYLYQGCFMMQAAYVAAFRGSLAEDWGQRSAYTKQQLDVLMEREVLSFSKEQREVSTGAIDVTVTLKRNTPLAGMKGETLMLERTQKAWCLDPVVYIRGVKFLDRTEEIETYEESR